MDKKIQVMKFEEELADTPDLVDSVALKELEKHVEVEAKPPEIKCGICNEKFTQEMAFKIHEMFHSKDNYCFVCRRNISNDFQKHIRDRHLNHICTMCNKVFGLKKTLNIHYRSHTKEKIFKCDKCDKSFMQQGALSIHITSTHQGIKPFVCAICKTAFTTKSSLRKHLKRMHTKSIYDCYICSQQFTDKKLKFDHERKHSKSKVCEFCGRKFATTNGLSKHLVVMHFNTEKCIYCERMFHKSMLDAHVVKKHRARECYTCKLTFYNAREFNNHLTRHKRKIMCKLCNRSYIEAQKEKHLQLHRENIFKKCKICQNVFIGYQALKQHIAVVHCVRPYKCLICKRGYKYLNRLEKHKLRHDDKKEYKFQCIICDIKYIHQRSLKNHLIWHHSPTVLPKDNDELQKATIRKINILQSNKSKFQCKKCRKVFKHYQSVKKHICTTYNAHGFNCSLCPQRYRLKKDLVEHLEEKHPGNNLKCSICGYMFINKSCLEQHMRMHMLNGRKKRLLENESKNISEEEIKIVVEHIELENRDTENQRKNISEEEMKIVVEHIKLENRDAESETKCISDEEIKIVEGIKIEKINTTHTTALKRKITTCPEEENIFIKKEL